MSTTVRPYTPDDLPVLRAVLREPAISSQFDMYAGTEGAVRLLADPYTPAEGIRLAFVDGEPAGFSCAVLLPAASPWTMLRGGVLPRFQRRGVGRELHDDVAAFVRTQTIVPGIETQLMAAWEPLEPATAMAERLGYAHDRWFWLMRRERGATPPA